VAGNRTVGRGARLLELDLADHLPFPFEPGHVVVLRLGPVKHPYTLSWTDPDRRRVGLVFRVIPGGRLTPQLAELAPGAPVECSGLHHGPVRAEIAPAAKAVVGLSTGSGIGPLWGFASQALARGFDRPITLVAGFREAEDICLAPELDALQARHPGFRWFPTLTRPGPGWAGQRGRVGESAPALVGDPRACHFHLVGNGAMLAELREALAACGVPGAQVSSEVFFNFNAQADPGAVQAIAARFGGAPGTV
jgi:NAD(P)H-flavin reductase